MGKVLEVRGQTARIQLGGTTLEVRCEAPLAVGDRLLLQVANRDERGMVLKLLPQPVSQALTDVDLAAILQESGLPKEALPVAKALLVETGQLEPEALRTLWSQMEEAETGDAPGAAKLFGLGLPLTETSLRWVKRREEGLASILQKLQALPEEERKQLEPWVERLRFDPEKGFKPFREALESLRGSGIKESDLAQLAQGDGPGAELAAELLSVFGLSVLSSRVRPEVPFLLEGGEGHLERDGERIRLNLSFERLGKIRVELTQVEGRLSCLILADESEWSSRLAELKSKLEAQGYRPAIQVRRPPEGVPRVDLRL